jgi:integration host factor subunit beta
MTKSELVYKLHARFPHLSQKEVELVINKIIGCMVTNLEEGRRIELRGFGAFSLRARDPHMARNPKNGEMVEVSERRSVYFRAGKELREKLNQYTH